MLKITYLESGLYLEHLHETVEDWIALRVILALRTGQRLMVEQTTASLLLPIGLVKRSALESIARREQVMLSTVDDEYVEVSLPGTWVTSGEEAEGVFVASVNPSIEQIVFQLWTAAQVETSSIHR